MSSDEYHSRSREQTGAKRKRASQEVSIHEDIAWTAARCNRLLRTISSRINAIRRLIRNNSSLSTNSSESRAQPKRRRSEHWSSADPVWLPNGTKKLKGRTYAGKKKVVESTKHSQRQDQAASSLAFPSPFVRRIRDRIVDDVPQPTTRKPAAKSRSSRSLAVKPSSDHAEAEKGLKNALVNLLSQTESVAPQRESGSRSLLSTCLRKVPSYVKLEIDAADENDEAEGITSDVLSYLEDMGTKSGGGWASLGEVVRSQGLDLICSAIEDGLIREDTARALAAMCCSNGAHSEGQQILRANLFSTEHPVLEIETTFHETCGSPSCLECKYEWLCDLTDRGAATVVKTLETPGFCNTLLCRLTVTHSPAAWRLVSQSTMAFRELERAGIPTSQSSTMLKGTMARTAAMAWAGSTLGIEASCGPTLSKTLNRLAAQSIIACVSHGQRCLSSNTAQLMLCSQFLVGLEGLAEPNMIMTWAVLSEMIDTWSDLPSRKVEWRLWKQEFVDDIADAIIELDMRMDLGLIEKLLSRVLEVTVAKSGATVLQEISLVVVSGAGHLQGAVGDSVFADFLQQLASLTSESVPLQTPYRKRKPDRFRWEDGLSEWVLATPFAASVPKGGYEDLDAAEEPAVSFDSGYYSPQVVLPSCFSPDVLAMSPPIKKVQRPVYSPPPVEARKKSIPKKVSPEDRPATRKSRRISEKENCEDSGDELGF